METKCRPKDRGKQYKITTIRDGQMRDRTATRQQLTSLRGDDIDVVINEPKRDVVVKPNNGVKSTPPCTISGLGVYVWDLLMDAVFAAGEIVPLKSHPSMNTRVRRLRRAFGDSKSSERFFKTSAMPYGIAINTDRAWRVIETLAE